MTKELQNLMLSVTLGKVCIINPTIFDKKDLKITIGDEFTNVTIADLMQIANTNFF